MVSLKFLFTSLVLGGIAGARNIQVTSQSTTAPTTTGSDLENARPSPDLVSDQFNVVLRKYPAENIPYVIRSQGQPKYRNGVFEFNQRVLNRLKSTDRELARRLVSVVSMSVPTPRMGLVKRQDSGNGTVSTSIDVETSTVIKSSKAPVTTVEETSTAPATTRNVARPTSDTEPEPEPKSSESSSSSVFVKSTTFVTSSFARFHRPSSTDDFTPSSSFAEPSSTSFKSPPSKTTSSAEPSSTSSDDEDDSESTKAPPPPPKPTTKITLQTKTLENGDVSTATKIAVITPTPSPTDGEAPSLQTGSWAPNTRQVSSGALALAVCAIGMSWVM